MLKKCPWCASCIKPRHRYVVYKEEQFHKECYDELIEENNNDRDDSSSS